MRWRTHVAPVACAVLLVASCGSDNGTTGEGTGDTTEAPSPATTERPPETTPETSDAPAETTSTTALTSPETTLVPDEVDDAADGFSQLAARLDEGDLGVTIDVPEGGVSGELFRLTFVNETDDDLDVALPCGLIFAPDGPEPDSWQPMMNVSPIDISLGGGESLTVEPFVMCVDSEAAAPGPGTSYELGEMATGDLLALAECICDEDLVSESGIEAGDLSLQLAVWATADGELPELEGLDDEGALGDLVSGELGVDLDELMADVDLEGTPLEGMDLDALLEQAMAFLDGADVAVERWLDRCDIDLGS